MSESSMVDHRLPAFAELMRRAIPSGSASSSHPASFNPHQHHNGEHRSEAMEGGVSLTHDQAESAMDLCFKDSRYPRVSATAAPAIDQLVSQERLEEQLTHVPELVAGGRRLIFQDVAVLVTRLDGVDILTGMKTSFFKCHICGKACSNLRRLQKHLGMHCESRVAYKKQCPMCAARFKFKVHLFRHIRTVHRVSPHTVIGNSDGSTRQATSGGLSRSAPAERQFISAAAGGSFMNRVHSVIENVMSEDVKQAKSRDYTESHDYVNDVSDVSMDNDDVEENDKDEPYGSKNNNNNNDTSNKVISPKISSSHHKNLIPIPHGNAMEASGYKAKIESQLPNDAEDMSVSSASKRQQPEAEEADKKGSLIGPSLNTADTSPSSMAFTSMINAAISPSSSVSNTTPLLTQSGFMAGLPTIPLLSPPLSGLPNPLQIMPLMPMLNQGHMQGHLLNNPGAMSFMQQQVTSVPGTSNEPSAQAQSAEQSRAMSIVAYNQEVLRNRARVALMKTLARRRSRKVCRPTTLPDGTQVFRCFHCHKDYNSLTDLNRHLIVHGDSRPYKCRLCDYYARAHSQLKVHMMRHQGIREYHCKICNYKGVTQSDLNRHYKSKVHMLKAQFPCFQCDEGFTSPKFRDLHILQHHMEPKMERKDSDDQGRFDASLVKDEEEDGSVDLSRTIQPGSVAVFPGQDRDLHVEPETTSS